MPRRRLRDLSIVQNPLNSEETNSEQQTGIGSSNVPNTADKPVELKEVGRAELQDVHYYKIYMKARLLAGYWSIISRNANLLPINYKSWHHMPDSNKNQALDNIKDRERVGTTSRQKQKFTPTVGSKRETKG
ncbi:Glycerol-3-phosphate dehydrogenase [NAD(P)+] [Gossypium arboreum]|uniref:Glycerol-3-phosphate dehydrogenase [NAD(P)+] n=1 Tax=Gossypium arboreum TaxID=29729 RepID=A0A0B0PHR4_GOSAR|nr:Glycerol-3-phosphate dehydrogenase [NAD(P)+] [Gossypium arboreum]